MNINKSANESLSNSKQKMWPIVLIAFVTVAECTKPFPEGFKFGTSTSAYQTEGAWNADGKGESVWDFYTHILPIFLANADVACDSYHKWEEDVQILKTLGIHTYRLSISWSRILPNGTADYINQKGVEYYLKIFKALEANGIEPIVTIYHGDLPIPVNNLGGWINPDIVDYFGDYARLCFELFGGYVKRWLTINEPRQICPPGEYVLGWGLLKNYVTAETIYQCSYIVVKAHARAYHIYHDEFRNKQGGKVSIVLDMEWLEPYSDSLEDLEATEREFQFSLGRFANPIYLGNWPEVMIDQVAQRSLLEGYNTSRLPEMTPEDVDYINGTYDFFALNAYTSSLVQNKDDYPIGRPDYGADKSTNLLVDPTWPPSNVSFVVSYPEGIRKLLNWIDVRYRPGEILVTENGWPDGTGELNDTDRIIYLDGYLRNVLDAIHEDGVNVVGYSVWSLIDNYEWTYGYRVKFGLVHVDFDSPNRTRSLKRSADWYRRVVTTKCLDDTCQL